jgi:ABC-2 type transport system permease protein
MTLWRLEVARLLRTHRWMILAGVFGLFAVIGPVGATYLEEILTRFGGGVVVDLPAPRPLDGIAQYLEGVSQLGILAVVILAAAALAVDARPEVAAFVRTRVTRPHLLVLPRYAVVAAAAGVALAGGMAVAWALSSSLLGALPAGPVLLGTLLGALYLAFAVAVVAAVAGYTRGVIGTIVVAVVALVLLPLVALVEPVRPWLPSELLTAALALADGAPAGEFLRATAVTVVVTPALLALAVHRVARRES